MPSQPHLPTDLQHIAIAGMTGSGKTWGALDMLARRDFEKMAWIIIDHKGDADIKRLPAEPMKVNPVFMPHSGLHLVKPRSDPKWRDSDRQDLEDLLLKGFKKGHTGFYIDEGHLMGPSPAVRHILVAGRSKHVPLMWTSQRANWIDSFIWAQSTFYRVFKLQTFKDIKAVQENWPVRFENPHDFRSRYFDGVTIRYDGSNRRKT
jgi:hypothetical protein